MLVTPGICVQGRHPHHPGVSGARIRALVLDIDNTLTADRSQELPDKRPGGWLR